MLCLPSKEYSIAVRFSPVKYKLKRWPAAEKEQEGSADVAGGGAQGKTKPWEENKTLFALPYRMVYAVATSNSVVLYDTQQEEAWARVSQIHYIGLTDLTWYGILMPSICTTFLSIFDPTRSCLQVSRRRYACRFFD